MNWFRKTAAVLALVLTFGVGYTAADPYLVSSLASSTYLDVTWQGTTDENMLAQVTKDLAAAKKQGRHLRVQLLSGGGPVTDCLEIARRVRNAVDDGLLVEIHGSGLVASCGTFVLASGTPGHRYISHSTLFLIHAPQRGGYFGGSCVAWVDVPQTEDDKIGNEILLLMAVGYARLTGHRPVETLSWIKCGNEALGVEMALKRGLADKLEM